MKQKKLSLKKELKGVSYKLVKGGKAFIDHNGEGASVAPKRFRNLGYMRHHLHNMVKQDCVIYVFDLWERDFGEIEGIWYYLNCAYRRKEVD